VEQLKSDKPKMKQEPLSHTALRAA